MSNVSNSQLPFLCLFHNSWQCFSSCVFDSSPSAPHASTPPLSGISRHHPLGDRWSTHAPITPPAHRLFWKKCQSGSGQCFASWRLVAFLVIVYSILSITCFGAMFTFVVSNYLCNHRDYWNVSRTWCRQNPRNQPLQKDSRKRQSDKSTKSSKTNKDHGSTPKRSTDPTKRSHPTHLRLMGLCWNFLCFLIVSRAPISLLWQVRMLFWFWCSFNGHGMQVLEGLKAPCVMGNHQEKEVDLGEYRHVFLAEISHFVRFASTSMSAVGFLEPLPSWNPHHCRS